MEGLIVTVVYIGLACLAIYGIWWLCVKFSMPLPVFWIVGGILLIILLFAVARFLGVGGSPQPIFPRP